MEHDDAWHLTDRVSHETGRGDPFAAAIRATRMPMIITDPNRHDNPIVFVNDAFLELTGYARDEIMGRNCRFLQGADTDPEAAKALAEAIKARQDISIEILNYRKDKTSFWNALYISPVFNQDNVVQFFFASQVNMTALLNEKIETARAAAVIRSIVDTVRDPLVVLDADLQITLASRNFVRMFGDEEADVIGKRIDELKQGQWNVAALRALLDRVVPDETPFNDFLVEDDFPGLGHRVFKLNARKIHVPGNHTTNLLLAFEDVTDAVAADRHRDMLAAELAHRIKNSLAVISAFVSFEIRRAAKPCVAGYQAMQTRINAVAELYDVIAHSSAFGPVDAPAYLAGIADSIRTSLLGSGSQIDIVVDAEPMHIVAENAVTIGLLVNELATNAVKYAFSEGRGRIVLGFRRRGEDIVLSVEDDGSGFDGSVSRTTPASGMGTRFIDAFVLQIGGTLGRASGPTGTTVTIRLPASILSS